MTTADLLERLASSQVAERLAVYGSLQPGGSNHQLLADLDGFWIKGEVRGTLHAIGWAAVHGYPGLELDNHGPAVPVHLFCSRDLATTWPCLDAFEGPDYRRVVTAVRVGREHCLSNIYELARAPF